MSRFSVNRASLRAVAVAIATTATLGLASAASATIISDGDFSSPTVSGSFQSISAGGTIGAWTVVDGANDPGVGSVDLIGNYWLPPTLGGQSVDLDGLHPGGVSQTFTAAQGKYLLTFWLSGNPDGPPVDKLLNVSVGSANGAYDYNLTANGTQRPNHMNYVQEQLGFTITGSGPTTLSFLSNDPADQSAVQNIPAFGPVIGGISIAAVPEPASWALLLMGIASIGGGLRLQRAKGLAAA
jgi:hypothetical protein